MSLARSLRPFTRAVAPLSRTTRAPAFANSRTYAQGTADTVADGASDKTIKNAGPKILNTKPPKDGEAGDNVEQHNKEVSERAIKRTDRDNEDDKVEKGFWQGQAGHGDRKG